MARKNVPLYWISDCVSINLNFVLNLPFQSNLLNLSPFASVPDRFELNIINLLLLHACFFVAGNLLLSFYFTGILLLGETLSRISFKYLDVITITTLSDFFISRLVSLCLTLLLGESLSFRVKYFPRSLKYKKDGRERTE
jgi:hypothetical protein